MTKSLTEQWRDGTLEDGHYYIIPKEKRFGDILIDRFKDQMNDCGDEWRGFDNCQGIVKEVLAPVPSYEECKEMDNDLKDMACKYDTVAMENGRLQKQLEIATKALNGCYNDMKYWAVLTHRNQRILSVIKKALKEMEGVK